MPKRLLQGAAVNLVDGNEEPVRRVLFGATWSSVGVDVDMCALLLTRSGAGYRVPSEQDFLYRNRRTTPDRSAFLTYLTPGQSIGPDRAQIMLDFGSMNPEVSRVVIAMSALRQGGLLREMGTLRTRAMDLATGETMYVYQHSNAAALDTQCITLWTLDRTGNRWQARVSATPYPGGPPALVRDYGAKAS